MVDQLEQREAATELDPGTAWDRAAAPWDIFVESGADFWRTEVHGPALVAACGPVAGLRVLDLGCGQGWFSRQLAQGGAEVVGVDISANQIANARRHEAEEPLGITYLHLDAMRVAEQWPANSFDLVTACMVLHDLPDATAVLAGARQVVVPSGRVIFSILHPLTNTPFHGWVRDEHGRKTVMTLDRYFDVGQRIEQWNMTRLTATWEAPVWHRTLSELSEVIAAAGLAIRRLSEPRPTPEQVERYPAFEPATRMPYFLIVELARA